MTVIVRDTDGVCWGEGLTYEVAMNDWWRSVQDLRDVFDRVDLAPQTRVRRDLVHSWLRSSIPPRMYVDYSP